MTRLVLEMEGSAHSYELTATVGGAELGDLITLKRYNGVTVRSIQEMFDQTNLIYSNARRNVQAILKEHPDASKPGSAHHDELMAAFPDDLAMLDDEGFLNNIIGVVFLSRRKAGEDITPEDAAKTSWQSFRFDNDEEAPDAPKVDTEAEPIT